MIKQLVKLVTEVNWNKFQIYWRIKIQTNVKPIKNGQVFLLIFMRFCCGLLNIKGIKHRGWLNMF